MLYKVAIVLLICAVVLQHQVIKSLQEKTDYLFDELYKIGEEMHNNGN